MDQLLQYQFDRIFPGCRLLDIHEYLLERGVKLETPTGLRYMYHDPCHTPMKTHQPLKVVNRLMGQDIPLSDRCCGESGTFAVTRPDIATQVRFRKEEELRAGIAGYTGEQKTRGEVKILTSCPACQQGLSRYTDATGIESDYIVVELANRQLGEGWQQRFIERAKNGGIERVLL
jgi:Fe-S oxidoreductase